MGSKAFRNKKVLNNKFSHVHTMRLMKGNGTRALYLIKALAKVIHIVL